VAETADQAARAAGEILSLFAEDRRRIEALGRPAGSMLRVHQLLQARPVTSIPGAATQLGMSPPTVSAAIAHLQQLGIVREMTGKQRGRVYLYDEYMKILNVGTEPYRREGTPRERTHLA
jgi:Fic family protein